MSKRPTLVFDSRQLPLNDKQMELLKDSVSDQLLEEFEEAVDEVQGIRNPIQALLTNQESLNLITMMYFFDLVPAREYLTPYIQCLNTANLPMPPNIEEIHRNINRHPSDRQGGFVLSDTLGDIDALYKL